MISPFFYKFIVNFFKLEQTKQNKIILSLYFIQTSIIVGGRALNTGADTNVYYLFYQFASIPGNEIIALKRFEPLFSLICLICVKLGFSFTVFNIIIAAITMFFFMKAVEKFSNAELIIYTYISFCFFYNMMNQVRQALAMMIVLYGCYLFERK